MKIYSLSAGDAYFGVDQVTPNLDPDFPLLSFKEKRSFKSVWKPVEVKVDWYDYSRKNKVGAADFPTHPYGALIMGGNAARCLADYLEPYGELLPLQCDEAEFWAFNVLKEVDALDAARSTPLYDGYENGSPIGPQVDIITPYAFFTERLEGIDLFRVPELFPFFMTERFVQKVESLGLTGLTVRCEFDSERDKYGFDYMGQPLLTPKP
jgi:hypothetical protein